MAAMTKETSYLVHSHGNCPAPGNGQVEHPLQVVHLKLGLHLEEDMVDEEKLC